jgi:hypothetical protein
MRDVLHHMQQSLAASPPCAARGSPVARAHPHGSLGASEPQSPGRDPSPFTPPSPSAAAASRRPSSGGPPPGEAYYLPSTLPVVRPPGRGPPPPRARSRFGPASVQ